MERRHSDGRGLLAVDGAAHGNHLTGDAPHVSLTMSAVPLLAGKARRARGNRDRFGAGYYAYFANPLNGVRTLASSLVDIAREVTAATRQRRANVHPRANRGGFCPFARAGTNVIARDVVVSAIIGDMLAGRSCMYADSLGYDEVAHHSGIERFDALAVLRTIDQQIGRLHRATQLALRRYHVVALSDHGQTQGWAFADRFGESIEQLVGRLCGGSPPDPSKNDARRPEEGWQVASALAEASSGGGPIARRLRARVDRAGSADDRPRTVSGAPGAVTRAAPGVVAVASGHVAMVSFTEHPGRAPLETIEREFPDLLPALVDHPGVGFLLVRRVDTFPPCPDVMINSNYDPATDDASPFEPHVGSHGGMGGPQSRGFLMYPAELPAPGEIVGAEAVHQVLRGWLTALGHPEPTGARGAEQAAHR